MSQTGYHHISTQYSWPSAITLGLPCGRRAGSYVEAGRSHKKLGAAFLTSLEYLVHLLKLPP